MYLQNPIEFRPYLIALECLFGREILFKFYLNLEILVNYVLQFGAYTYLERKSYVDMLEDSRLNHKT